VPFLVVTVEEKRQPNYQVIRVKRRMLTIIVASMKIMDDFCCEWKLLHAYHKSTLRCISKDKWDTKEGTGKSMMNTLYACNNMAKSTSWAGGHPKKKKKSSL